MLHFCPKCHRPAYREEEAKGESILDYELFYELDDVEMEALATRQPLVRIISHASGATALTCSPQSKNISFGCPWCRNGKVTVLKGR